MTTSETARAYVDAINERSLSRMASLMTEDHVFIDALDNRLDGRNAIIEAWRGYFAMVPDYAIQIEKILEKGSDVALFGRARGRYALQGWEIPAAWLAEVRDEKIFVWRVFADNLPIRRLMSSEP